MHTVRTADLGGAGTTLRLVVGAGPIMFGVDPAWAQRRYSAPYPLLVVLLVARTAHSSMTVDAAIRERL